MFPANTLRAYARPSGFWSYPLKACGVDYLETLTRVGFLFSVESLLSTYDNELGILGDKEVAVKELGRVCIKLRLSSLHVLRLSASLLLQGHQAS